MGLNEQSMTAQDVVALTLVTAVAGAILVAHIWPHGVAVSIGGAMVALGSKALVYGMAAGC